MSKGGFRPGAGRKPDPNALRPQRMKDGEFTVLPASGRQGPTPPWPLPAPPTEAAAEIWERIWKKPQAILWEQDGSFDNVAVYCQLLAEASLPNAPAVTRTAWRQMGEQLYLTGPTMRTARLKISTDEVAEKRTENAIETAPGPSMRDRMKAVGGGA